MSGKNSGPIYSPKELLYFPGGSDGKESACNAADLGSIPGLGREWLATPVFWPGELYEQRSLKGYSPWGHKDLEMSNLKKKKVIKSKKIRAPSVAHIIFLLASTALDSLFSSGTSGKEPTCQCRRHKRHRFDPWVGNVP